MPTPFTTLSAGQDFASIVPGFLLYQIQNGAQQRLRAVFGDGYTIAALPSAGQPILKTTFWGFYANNTQPLAVQQAVFGRIDGSNARNAGPGPVACCFVDHRNPLLANAPNWWTVPNLRVAAGLPTTRFFHFDPTVNADPVEDTSLQNWLLKRARRREIVNPGDTRDTQGNPAVAGQRAFGAANRDSFGPGTAVAGRIYRCVSSGNWVPDATQQPDLIDNTQTVPNTVTEFFGSSGTAALTYSFGYMRVSDCVGIWVPNELTSIMDLLRWTAITLNGSGYTGAVNANDGNSLTNPTTGVSRGAGGYGYSSSASALSAAYATYGAQTPSGPANNAYAYVGLDQQGTPSNQWDAYVSKQGGMSWAPNVPVSGIAKKWYFYNLANPPSNVANFTAGITPTFDAQGDPVTNGVYNNWASSPGAVLTTTPTSPTWSPVTTAPPDSPPAPGTGAATAAGYEIDDVVLLCKWNVNLSGTPGFTNCSVTD